MRHAVPAQYNEQRGEYLPCTTYLTTTSPRESVAAELSESQQCPLRTMDAFAPIREVLTPENIETTNMLRQHAHADKQTKDCLLLGAMEWCVEFCHAGRQYVTCRRMVHAQISYA
ncbi:hypothetical protein E2C01_005020 [Portunus trituberculatus]|uniref:Uncharacterized protein n=1 Tax=Portunus trituberculatus TaxID=210409 RepID=A0A5B7CRI7_PORTR|nr:hypothetical protein [Portunus trituberculatus]